MLAPSMPITMARLAGLFIAKLLSHALITFTLFSEHAPCGSGCYCI